MSQVLTEAAFYRGADKSLALPTSQCILFDGESISFDASLVIDGFGAVVVSMLASDTQVCGFKPGRSRWIFTDVKILSMPSSGGEVKESVPLRHVKGPSNLRELLIAS